ncbi:MAG: DNA polymerase IV [Planctomycetota bacterium]|nr:MAG: DNA polymerase IV [Planctomycetota bacterium]
MTSARLILHADMDAFYASIEQRDEPSLRGLPVVIGGLGKRGVVSTCSYEARVFGVHSALPTAIARQRCPQAVYLPGRIAHYAAVSAQLRAIFEEFTDLVEPLSLDEAFLDVTGSARLFGSGEHMARRLQDRVAEELRLGVSVGVASNKFVAKVASDREKPRGITVVPRGGEAAFLAPLPVRSLWGVGPATAERLTALGVHTVGQLADFEHARLCAALGDGLAAHVSALARGRDDRPVIVDREAKSIGRETTFEDDLVERASCHEILLRLAEDVGRRLRAAGLRAHTVRLKLRHPPFVTLSRQVRLDQASDDELQIYREAQALFDAARPSRRPVRLLGVTAADLRPASEGRQAELFGAAADTRGAAVREALDAVRVRFGASSVRRAGTGADTDPEAPGAS